HRFADRLDQAVDAARQVSMPDDAYGVICQFLPPVLNPLEEHGVAALQGSAEGIQTTAANIKDTAEDYAAADDRNALALHRMTGTR
ncbi:MAG: type VII secretion target, partial [Pseudonocardiaceae bacterium]